jgi:hypothetical protein
VEAKCFAYAFVFFALSALVAGKWTRVWPLLGVASAFHVLVGGWAAVAAVFAWLIQRRRDNQSVRGILPSVLLGALLAVPGLLPAMALNLGAPPSAIRDANQIYVFKRLAHHLVFHTFAWYLVARHVALLVGWVLASRFVEPNRTYQRFSAFVWGAVLVSGAGIIVDFATIAHAPTAAAWLRYYWFRLSDAMLPAAVAVTTAVIIAARDRPWPVRLAAWTVVGCAAVALVLAVRDTGPTAQPQGLAVQRWVADRRGQQLLNTHWQQACRWVMDNVPVDSLCLTPLHQQTFKWYAQRAEVVTWKDVPQDAVGLAEWWRRRRLYPEFPTDLPRLRRLAEQYHAQYVVTRKPDSPIEGFETVYENPSFVILEPVAE